jgi:hypothetical protein
MNFPFPGFNTWIAIFIENHHVAVECAEETLDFIIQAQKSALAI